MKTREPYLLPRLKDFLSVLVSILLFILPGTNSAFAGVLADRITTFPEWQGKPNLPSATGDLIYPEWLAGTWSMTSTLVEQVAPLAPEVVSPGFEGNQKYLNQPISSLVRFVVANSLPRTRQPLDLVPLSALSNPGIVADRAFNGLNLARAYLGEQAVIDVKFDPAFPNRQITELAQGRQLISVVTARASEAPDVDHFIATELFQQVFRGNSTPYVNQVETTTAYERLPSISGSKPAIEADQITAIYLSPQDPQYFKAQGRPVALYRYRLEFSPVQAKD